MSSAQVQAVRTCVALEDEHWAPRVVPERVVRRRRQLSVGQDRVRRPELGLCRPQRPSGGGGASGLAQNEERTLGRGGRLWRSPRGRPPFAAARRPEHVRGGSDQQPIIAGSRGERRSPAHCGTCTRSLVSCVGLGVLRLGRSRLGHETGQRSRVRYRRGISSMTHPGRQDAEATEANAFVASAKFLHTSKPWLGDCPFQDIFDAILCIARRAF